jgi:hypothetical protein
MDKLAPRSEGITSHWYTRHVMLAATSLILDNVTAFLRCRTAMVNVVKGADWISATLLRATIKNLKSTLRLLQYKLEL